MKKLQLVIFMITLTLFASCYSKSGHLAEQRQEVKYDTTVEQVVRKMAWKYPREFVHASSTNKEDSIFLEQWSVTLTPNSSYLITKDGHQAITSGDDGEASKAMRMLNMENVRYTPTKEEGVWYISYDSTRLLMPYCFDE